MSGVKRQKVFWDDGGETIKRFHEVDCVLASEYDRDTARLRKEKSLAIAGMLENHNAFVNDFEAGTVALLAERDELRAQIEAMRAALEDAAKGILWLQASVPMSLRISKRASKDYNAAKRAALQAKP